MRMTNERAAGRSPVAQVVRGDPHMNKPLLAALSSLALAGLGAAPAVAAPHTVVKPRATVDFAGTVALSDCSGSVIRFPNSADSDPALVLTNGHCLETGFPDPGQVITGQS